MSDLTPAVLKLRPCPNVRPDPSCAARSVNRGKIRSSGQPLPRRTQSEEMTTVPTEINAAAVKNSATDKHTPMMQQYLRVTFS